MNVVRVFVLEFNTDMWDCANYIVWKAEINTDILVSTVNNYVNFRHSISAINNYDEFHCSFYGLRHSRLWAFQVADELGCDN